MPLYSDPQILKHHQWFVMLYTNSNLTRQMECFMYLRGIYFMCLSGKQPIEKKVWKGKNWECHWLKIDQSDFFYPQRSHLVTAWQKCRTLPHNMPINDVRDILYISSFCKYFWQLVFAGGATTNFGIYSPNKGQTCLVNTILKKEI